MPGISAIWLATRGDERRIIRCNATRPWNVKGLNSFYAGT